MRKTILVLLCLISLAFALRMHQPAHTAKSHASSIDDDDSPE